MSSRAQIASVGAADLLQLLAPVMRHDGGDARQHDLGLGNGLVGAGLGGGQVVIVIAHPGRHVEGKRAPLQVGSRPQLLQDLRPHLEQAAEERIGLGPGGAQHQPVDAVGLGNRQHLAHRAAGRMAAPMDLGEAQPVDQLQGIVGHLLDGVIDLGQRAARGTAMIVHDDGKFLGKLAGVGVPEAAVAAQTGHQEQRRATALLFVVELRAIAQLQMRHLPDCPPLRGG